MVSVKNGDEDMNAAIQKFPGFPQAIVASDNINKAMPILPDRTVYLPFFFVFQLK